MEPENELDVQHNRGMLENGNAVTHEGNFVHPFLEVLNNDLLRTHSNSEKEIIKQQMSWLVERTRNVIPDDNFEIIVRKTAFGQTAGGLSNPVLALLGGGGGSGKTSGIPYLSELTSIPFANFTYINPDEIMEVLPQYSKSSSPCRASWYHEIASQKANELFNESISARYNVLYDGTMGNPESWGNRITFAQNMGYDQIVMVGVTVPTIVAAIRAATRAEHSNRWVPLEALVSAHAGYSNAFETYISLVNTTLLLDNTYASVEQVYEKNSSSVWTDTGLFEQFLSKGKENMTYVANQIPNCVIQEYDVVANCPPTEPSSAAPLGVISTYAMLASISVVSSMVFRAR